MELKTIEEKNRVLAKYPYIVAWGKILGSNSWFVEEQCRKADKENAPTDATHQKFDSDGWSRIGELSADMQAQLKNLK